MGSYRHVLLAFRLCKETLGVRDFVGHEIAESECLDAAVWRRSIRIYGMDAFGCRGDEHDLLVADFRKHARMRVNAPRALLFWRHRSWRWQERRFRPNCDATRHPKRVHSFLGFVSPT